jgi:site-specific DNA-methyltransferase (adenine-specific)
VSQIELVTLPPCHALVADPPWLFGDALPPGRGAARGAGRKYATLTVDEIASFHLPPIEPDAWLFLWRVAALQAEALHVAEAWGFRVVSEIVWAKTTATGKEHFGMGHYVRAAHETCLVAVRGRPKPASRSIRSRFAAPIGIHSAKPERFYQIVEQLVGSGPFVEMFARRRRVGWTAIGREAP